MSHYSHVYLSETYQLSSLVDKFGNENGKIKYEDFFNKLGVTVQPGDLQGLSHQISQENQDTVVRLHNEQCDK